MNKPIAVLPMTNWGGLVILDIDSDCVLVADGYGNGISNARRYKLHPLKNDYSFRRYGVTYRLSQFMRV